MLTREGPSSSPQRMEKDIETPKCRVAAVIPAAGCGQRMGNPTPKQYLEVSGRPLVLHCLKALEELPWVERTVLVADDHSRMANVLQKEGLSRVTVVTGTGSRHRSIRVGVEELSSDPPDVVVVHDGVRPLVPVGILTQVVNAAAEAGAAGAVRPLVSTVIKPDKDGFLQESLVRSQFLNSEMPQAFKYQILQEAYQRCTEYELEHGTECLALALNYCGVRAKLVTGSPQLWKVTDEKDLAVARILVPKYTRRILIICRSLTSIMPYQGEVFQERLGAGDRSSVEKDLLDTTKRLKTGTSQECHSKAPILRSESSEHQVKPTIEEVPPKTAENEKLLPCDHECLGVYETLKTTLEENSQKVFVCSELQNVSPPVCSLIVISNFSDLASFKEFAGSLFQRLDQRLVTVILVLSLDPLCENLSLSDISSLQQFLREVSSRILIKVTLVLRKIRKLTSEQREHEAKSSSMSKFATDSQPVEETVPVNPPLLQPCSTSAGSANTNKLRDMIITILDQPTSCFHGQVLFIDED